MPAQVGIHIPEPACVPAFAGMAGFRGDDGAVPYMALPAQTARS